jgi:L-fuculose-phosphate aldolase
VTETTGVRFETVFLSKSPPDDERVDRLIYWCKRFHDLGLVPKSAGNLSFRTEDGFVITGSGINLGVIKKDELVEVLKVEIEEDRTLVYARGQIVPSKESLLHSEIYHLRAEVNAVFHIHDQLVLELADELEIPCTEREQPRGSYELVGETNKLLVRTEGVECFGLKNHGVVAMGETLEEAGRLAERINEMARSKALKKGGGK